MPITPPLPAPPASADLEWVVQHSNEILAYIRAVHGLRALQIRLTRPNVSPSELTGSDNAITLVLSLCYPSGVPARVSSYSATALGSYNVLQQQEMMDQLAALTTAVNALRDGEAAVQSAEHV